MSKLNIDQRTINDLFSDKKSDFLIPDYQRPYAWTQDECGTLWEDLYTFAFPNKSSQDFDSENDEYFLGPIVTFKNDANKLEIIDGQQRLTTVMLLLRAFYSKFETAQDDVTIETRKQIARCIWKTDEVGRPIFDRLKIDSEVASDNDKDEFLSILKTGEANDAMNSRYAKTFRYFTRKIADFVDETPMWTAYFPLRILNNVIMLPIEAESQDTALRIFSTLNDRGLPLSDADIFKSQFYKFYSQRGEKDVFIERWRLLEEGANSIFRPMRGTPMDELFTRYMYYRRAKMGIKDTTTASLRDFFSADAYAMLKDDNALSDLEALLGFWKRIDAQQGFSDQTLRRLFVLNYAPNGMWTYLVSVWLLSNKDKDGNLNEEEFCHFLNVITAFILAYAIERPGVNALRAPVYPEMINIVEHRPITFANYRFNASSIFERFRAYVFTNNRPVTKSILAWWAFNDDKQPLMSIDTNIEIEHIYARRRSEVSPLTDRKNLELLGNKSLLEKRINIRASDYKFSDKKKFYKGFVDGSGKERPGTEIAELRRIAAEKDDFTETDIEYRTDRIISSFVGFLDQNGLIERDE